VYILASVFFYFTLVKGPARQIMQMKATKISTKHKKYFSRVWGPLRTSNVSKTGKARIIVKALLRKQCQIKFWSL